VVQDVRTLYVHNVGAAAKVYQPQVQLLDPATDAQSGVTFAFDPPRVTVPAGGKVAVRVTLTADPAVMRPYSLRGQEAVYNADALDVLQVDGWVYLQEVDAGGAPVAGGDRPGVPFVLLPYRHSCVASATTEPFFLHAPGDQDPQWWYNACPETGTVRVYPQLGTDAEDADLPASLDLLTVGLRHFIANPDDPESDVMMEFAVQTRGSRRIPADVQLRIYIDLDRDGTFDHVAWTAYAADLGQGVEAGRWMVIHAPLEPGSFEPDPEAFEGTATYMAYDLDESVTRLLVSAEDLGLDLRGGSELFNVAVAAVDVRGDYPLVGGQPQLDVLPDGLFDGAGVPYDQLIHDCAGSLPEISIPGGGGSLVVPLTMACATPDTNQPLALMFHYPGNLPGGQLGVRQGLLSAKPKAKSIYLPYAYK
jgi:hypothetical protein